MEGFLDYLEDMSEGKFRVFQIVVGLLSAFGGGCCILFLGNTETEFNSFGLAGALVLCGGLPTLFRAKLTRSTDYLRWSIIAGLVIMLGVYIALRF